MVEFQLHLALLPTYLHYKQSEEQIRTIKYFEPCHPKIILTGTQRTYAWCVLIDSSRSI